MISFIIPTRNEEAVIEKILRCLSAYKGEKEIIISDGKSTDKTIAIAKRYFAMVIEGRDNGVQRISIGKNDGARASHGEYLLFLDADVYIPEINSFFQKAITLFESNSKLVGLTVSIRVFEESETLTDKIVFSIFNFYNWILNNYLGSGAAGGEFQMVRREVFEKLGGYGEQIVASEDYEFFQRVARVGKTYLAKDLVIFHTGRRAHKVGWPKLLTQWLLNGIFVFFSGKAYSKEWKVIR
jgi:glycosyltransferase involved in cell wall biosynthesis